MIVLLVIAVAAIAWRIATKRFTAAEGIVLAIAVLNYLVLAGQMLGCYGFKNYDPPEMRYWIQSGILFFGWSAWGLLEVSRFVAQKGRPAKFLLPLVVAVLAAIDVAMLVKPHVPGSRRNAYLRACDWAEEKIRADYKGPAKDAAWVYGDQEYHDEKRPALVAHTGLLAYRLNGRHASPGKFGAIDLPDYVFDEDKKIRLPTGASYELLDRVSFGRRSFSLYRRVKEAK